MKFKLPSVTIIGIDCVDAARLQDAMDICEAKIEFGKSKLLTSLNIDDVRLVKIPAINTIEEYSRFCIEELYKYVYTDFALIVQHDGFILNPESWENEFLKYDYIGAPWLAKGLSDLPTNLTDDWIVGNGGFCLRSKKFLDLSAQLSKAGLLPEKHPEDFAVCVLYRDIFEREGIKYAPEDVAKRFSIEGEEGLVFDQQFGFHGFAWTDIDKWVDLHGADYPEVCARYKKARS
jgi:hypothetical protein